MISYALAASCCHSRLTQPQPRTRRWRCARCWGYGEPVTISVARFEAIPWITKRRDGGILLRIVQFAPHMKPGRNDPCPCGSGEVQALLFSRVSERFRVAGRFALASLAASARRLSAVDVAICAEYLYGPTAIDEAYIYALGRGRLRTGRATVAAIRAVVFSLLVARSSRHSRPGSYAARRPSDPSVPATQRAFTRPVATELSRRLHQSAAELSRGPTLRSRSGRRS